MITDIIKLNGRSYDARTGKAVGHEPLQKKVTAFKKQVINDIVGHSTSSKKTVTRAAAEVKKLPNKLRSRTHSPSPLRAHHPEPSKTLVRFAVKKPAPSIKARSQVHAAVDSTSTLTGSHAPLKPSRTVNAERLQRAKQIHPSQLIHRFAKPEAQPIRPQVKPLAVTPAKTQPQATSAKATATAKPHERHFAAVLQQATSHEQPAVTQTKRRLAHVSNRFIAITVALLAIIIIGGFVLTQNLPQIDVRLASLHAGFQATLPSYQPAGFAFRNHVVATSGSVTLSYHSTTDSRQFTIAQQTSTLTTQSLHSLVASSNLPLQSWQDNGHTVYQYGNHMTWVSNGVWYQITNHADLSSTQLLDIATSM